LSRNGPPAAAPKRARGKVRVVKSDQKRRGKPEPAQKRGAPPKRRGAHETPRPRATPDARRDPHARGVADPRLRNAHGERPERKPEPADPAPRLDSEARLRSQDPLRVGDWLWTMREGSERDVVEELMLAGKADPRGVGPALVASRAAPGKAGDRLELTFARQGFRVTGIARAPVLAELASELVSELSARLAGAETYALQVFVPDSTAGNLLSQRAQELLLLLTARLDAALPGAKRITDPERSLTSIPLVQVCLYAPDQAAAGIVPTDQALSLAQGGRARMRLSGDFPSRAARKLEEAFAWLGVSPGPGELCVDLGAAPGGWSWLLLERRARVIAIDPARMDAKLMQNRRLQHVQGSAFDFAPEETVDWLFCDMAWRPLEVAEMLARWARRRYTRLLVANFKLPMKRKAEMVQRLRSVLEEGGYASIRARQLYHDRDEITLTARVR